MPIYKELEKKFLFLKRIITNRITNINSNAITKIVCVQNGSEKWMGALSPESTNPAQ